MVDRMVDEEKEGCREHGTVKSNSTLVQVHDLGSDLRCDKSVMLCTV